ncbi:acyltransferase family protein [Aurantimicrobium minutum]|uniref:acyltransferase family protein n=1 Tax=Aurantimicrobium minutum TaxID=708131 RepID=UPI0024772B4E|nr:acyltransferase family protein [Aurantimicrobium minutum]MDH6423795.1 peptidoglycan/LPS O-acetylase OafA/YrhL [Aurantimicrobium minutum]
MASTKPLRTDIQVLRAVAVMLVVLFHLWPGRVRSGFIGVDIFFVISGFLISSHLFSEAFSTLGVSVFQFWARRIRRLLPIAFLVVAATSIVVLVVLPLSERVEFGKQAIASVFYYENWVLAFDSVNYLNADNAPTAVQQYWSLSVEEQFYILWPLLLITVLMVSRKIRAKLSLTIFSTLFVLVLLSLSLSILLGVTNNPSGYFNTFSRIWEFGFGAICAFLVLKTSVISRENLLRAFQFCGWILLIASIALITPELQFPGWIAILPVTGTALILLGGSGVNENQAGNNKQLLKPATWLGGISYSMYLWHWPLIILFPFVFGHDLHTQNKIEILIAVVVISWASTRFVEKPLQNLQILTKAKPRRTFVAALLAAILCLMPVCYLFFDMNARAAHSAELTKELQLQDCFGAESRIPGILCSADVTTALVPDLALVHDDLPTEANACKSDTTEVTVCSFGKVGSKTKVALVGDSHAGHWFPALEQIALNNNWQLDLYLRSSCTFSLVPRSEMYSQCPIWSQGALETLVAQGDYKFAIITSLAPNLYNDGQSSESVTEGFASVWEPLLAEGTKIVVIKDTPYWLEDPLTCISQQQSDFSVCDVPQDVVFQTPDLEYLAAQQIDGVTTVDMTPYFCSNSKCSTVIGGVIVYSDFHHMTSTFSKSLRLPLKKALEEALDTKLK